MNKSDIFFASLLLGAFLAYYVHRLFRRWTLSRRLARARWGERQAADLLLSRGYNILAVQKRVPFTIWVDGKPTVREVQADFVVEKDGAKFVAEVKTGVQASAAGYAPTRRQLLEYYLIYRPHGILLVDMEKKQIREVVFGIGKGRLSRNNIGWFITWIAVAVIFGYLIGKGGFPCFPSG